MRKCITRFDGAGARGGSRHSATPRGEGRDVAKTENPRCFRETGKNADSRETRCSSRGKTAFGRQRRFWQDLPITA